VRFLLNKLPKRADEKLVLDDDVQLKFYRLQKISEGRIVLEAGESGVVSAPTAVGTGAAHSEQIELSRLIDGLNERFGTDFRPADELFFSQIREEALADSTLQAAARANTIENFKFVFDKALEGFFIDRMDQNGNIFNRFMTDKAFQQVVAGHLLKQVYEQIRGSDPAASAQSASGT
jgi:type I restriction enzyme, R subunit